jgi:hypothetical protein
MNLIQLFSILCGFPIEANLNTGIYLVLFLPELDRWMVGCAFKATLLPVQSSRGRPQQRTEGRAAGGVKEGSPVPSHSTPPAMGTTTRSSDS